jgi:hypothetical protein
LTALFEDDDLIPVRLGGDNASPLNHCRSRAALRLVITGLDLKLRKGAPVRPWL